MKQRRPHSCIRPSDIRLARAYFQRDAAEGVDGGGGGAVGLGEIDSADGELVHGRP